MHAETWSLDHPRWLGGRQRALLTLETKELVIGSDEPHELCLAIEEARERVSSATSWRLT